jgi:N-acetylmuramoyl-L-alanine amidase
VSRSVKVVRGDTLSGIASRYSVTLEALKSKNDLSSNSIRVGQVLIIPESG